MARSTASVVCVATVISFLGLAGCGKHGDHGQTVDTASDPIAAQIVADIEQPLLFAVSYDKSPGGFYAEKLDSNGSFYGVVAGPFTVEQANQTCLPEDFSFHFAPAGPWMAARVLQRLEGTALEKNGYAYYPSGKLKENFRFSASGGGCYRYYYYDLGQFHVEEVKLINEFDGPDHRTLATTKIRSYQVVAEFAPSAVLKAAAPTVTFGHFTWETAFEKNPVTAEWERYDYQSDTKWSP